MDKNGLAEVARAAPPRLQDSAARSGGYAVNKNKAAPFGAAVFLLSAF